MSPALSTLDDVGVNSEASVGNKTMQGVNTLERKAEGARAAVVLDLLESQHSCRRHALLGGWPVVYVCVGVTT